MCGICGIVYKDPRRRVDPGLLKRMALVQNHRGPDDQGCWQQDNVGLAHVRLSIIDLSPLGHQPMTNEDNSVWITFNGEIYNFLELREELRQKGHQFRSRTDTEVIVHLWEEEGVRCVERLRGMFAFAIWDDRQKTLFLARDRMGKKPLFYAMLPDRFLFASEIKAILEDPDFRPEPDLKAIHYYLAYQSVPSPYSAFRGIHKLPPAHCLLVKEGKGEPRRYWKLSYQNKLSVNGAKGEEDLQEEILERLREAVRIRLISDVPLGAFLSGGIDSSLVVALMAGICNEPVKTFSISFAQEEYNEAHYARMVADRYRTDHHEFKVTPDAKAIFPELVWHYNEPFADPSAIPTYYVSKLARQHVTVVLNGDGGDENFAGYPRYALNGSFEREGGLWPLLHQWLGDLYAWQDFVRQQRLWKDPAALRSFSPRLFSYYWRITHFHELHQAKLYTPHMRAATAHYPAFQLMLGKYQASDARDFLDALLNLDLELYLPDTLMVKVDIASMAHSLEARAPMLDHHFLEFTARIPANLKLKNGTESKYIFKKAAEAFLPEEVIYRPKMGFGVPTDHWFRHELRELVTDTLLSPSALGRGYFRRDFLEKLLTEHQSGEKNWQYLIWNLLMLELWHQMFIDKTLEPPVRKSA
ncbi:MAG: asparagine synthase (glutamine-hydrolyzing) [Desulfobaccales bacterium]